MTVVYEVWDGLTANRIGAFSIKAEAKALVLDVRRINGPAAAEDMAILRFDSDVPDEDPELILDGADLVASRRITV